MTFYLSPKSWRKVSLSDCCKIISGATPRRDIPEYWGGTIPWVTPKDLSKLEGSTIEDAPEYITEKGYRSCSTDLLPKGAVLFSSRAPIGHVAIAGRPMCTNQGFKSLIPGDEVTSLYLYWCLRKLVPEISARGTGTTFKEVSKAVMEEFQIPLPPLPEQKRIAAILDKADAIRRKRQQAVKLTEELLRSVFLDMFGDPVENSKNWPLMLIGKAIKAIETGWSANSEDRPRENDEWAVLKISSVTSGRFLPEEYKVVAEDKIDRELLTPKRGDLLFSRANTRELVAATCLVEHDEPKLFLPDKLWKIIPEEEVTCTEYLRYLLAHPKFREKLTKQATGTSGSMLNISQSKVRDIEMPVPPIKLQKQFADYVWRNYSIRNKLEASSQESTNLFNTLLRRAFQGKLNHLAASENQTD